MVTLNLVSMFVTLIVIVWCKSTLNQSMTSLFVDQLKNSTVCLEVLHYHGVDITMANSSHGTHVLTNKGDHYRMFRHMLISRIAMSFVLVLDNICRFCLYNFGHYICVSYCYILK